MLDLDTAAREIGAGRRGPNATYRSVTTDSRQVGPGDLFVALRGARFDGHDFVDQALAAGAAAVMVEDGDRVTQHNASLILVDDTLDGLGRLAAAWRARFHIPLVGVTGSNGKTTVKEMLAAVLRAHAGPAAVLATSGNLNNAIGLPLMLLRLTSLHRYAVVEMGMNHLEEIRYLARLAAPTVALVTNAGTAHLGELGSREAIAKAKGEIYEASPDAVAVINADDRFAGYWRGLIPGRASVEFGLEQPAAVRGELAGDALRVSTPDGTYELHLQVPGLHNLHNALAACAAAHALGIPHRAVIAGLNGYAGTKGRLQARPGHNGSRIIDDTYNANPDSTRAAMQVLAAAPGRRIVVLGDMGELGDAGLALHSEMGEEAKRLKLDRLFVLGELAAAAAKSFGAGGRAFVETDELCAALLPLLAADVTVLVKGSRFMRMERVVERLVAAPAASLAEGSH